MQINKRNTNIDERINKGIRRLEEVSQSTHGNGKPLLCHHARLSVSP